MKSNGYRTYMSGKWHVTVDGAFDAPNGSYPIQRGFDRYYGGLHGGGSYYKPEPLYNDLTRITGLPENYYYTTAITDSAVSFVRQHPSGELCFCMWLIMPSFTFTGSNREGEGMSGPL